MLRCLEALNDPERAKELEEKFFDDMAYEAGVDVATLHSARSIVAFAGYFGPFSDADFAQEGHVITKEQALNIVELARKYKFNQVRFNDPYAECVCPPRSSEDCAVCAIDDPDHEHNCFCCRGCNNATIYSQDIYYEIWKDYRDIYGD